MAGNVDVFVSYAREDRAHAEALAGLLATQGWAVWWDREIRIGQAFDEEIEAALTGARAVVVLWSQAATHSPWVRAEAGAATERGVLVPARLDDVDLPLRFRALQTADLRHWQPDAADPGVEELLAAVRALVESPPDVEGVGLRQGEAVPETADTPRVAGVSPPGRSRRRRMIGGLALFATVVAIVIVWALTSGGKGEESTRVTSTTGTTTTAPPNTSPSPTASRTTRASTPDTATTADDSAAPLECTGELFFDCRGASVEELQRLLALAGFDPGPADGEFGRRTENALLAFEEACRVCEVDGRIDSVPRSPEWTALVDAAAGPAPLFRDDLLSTPFDLSSNLPEAESRVAGPEALAQFVIDEFTSIEDPCGSPRTGIIVSSTGGDPADVVIDVAIPCADVPDAMFPYSGGFRIALTIEGDPDRGWTVTTSKWQVYCPRGVERGSVVCTP